MSVSVAGRMPRKRVEGRFARAKAMARAPVQERFQADRHKMRVVASER
jgi:hypothetical protein